MITNVETPGLVAGAGTVIANVASTSAVLAGEAPTMTGAVPAGTDEASVMASANVTAHTAQFMGTAAKAALEMGRYGMKLATTAATYEVVDDANSTMFL